VSFQYDKETNDIHKLELREIQVFDNDEKYYGFW
jgi:hypothetical protein